MAEDELDLSELLDEPDMVTDKEAGEVGDPAPDFQYPDRIFLLEHSTHDGDFLERDEGDEDAVEYIRADAIREGFTKQIWREAVRYARRTAGQPTAALKRARDLIEEGR